MEKMKQGTVYNHFIPVHFWLKLKALPDCFSIEEPCSFSYRTMISGNTMPRTEPSVSIKMKEENPQEARRRSLPGKKPFSKWDFFWENVCEVTSWVTGYSVFSGTVGWCWKGDTRRGGQVDEFPGHEGCQCFTEHLLSVSWWVHTRELGVSKADIHEALKELKVHQGRDL